MMGVHSTNSENYFKKPLHEVTEQDLQTFITNSKEENLTLEYKSSRLLNDIKNAKIRVCETLSAMANSEGGLLIIGIDEINQNGKNVAGSIYGVNPEYTKETISQLFFDSVNPRIPNLNIHSITLQNGSGEVFVIDVPPSEIAPHMSSDNRYYQRSGCRSLVMEHYLVSAYFGKRIRPKLRPVVLIKKNINNEIEMVFYIRNEGKGVAKWPFFKVVFIGCEIANKNYKPLIANKISIDYRDAPTFLFMPSDLVVYPSSTIALFSITLPIDSPEFLLAIGLAAEESPSDTLFAFINLESEIKKIKGRDKFQFVDFFHDSDIISSEGQSQDVLKKHVKLYSTYLSFINFNIATQEEIDQIIEKGFDE